MAGDGNNDLRGDDAAVSLKPKLMKILLSAMNAVFTGGDGTCHACVRACLRVLRRNRHLRKAANDQGRNYMMNPPWRFLTSLCVGGVVAMLMAGCSTREASHDGNLLQTANTPHESASSCETAAELKTFIRLISDARNPDEIDNALRESFGLTGEGRSELSISSRCWKITIGAPFDHPLRFVEIVLKDEVHLGLAKSPKIKGSCISVDSLVDDKSTGKDRVVERQIGSDIPIVHLSTGAAQLSRMRLALHDDCVFLIEVIR